MVQVVPIEIQLLGRQFFVRGRVFGERPGANVVDDFDLGHLDSLEGHAADLCEQELQVFGVEAGSLLLEDGVELVAHVLVLVHRGPDHVQLLV